MSTLPQAMPERQPRLWLASGPPSSFQLEEEAYAKAPLKTALALARCIYVCMYRCQEVTAPKLVCSIHRLRKPYVTFDGDGLGDDGIMRGHDG